MDCVSLYLVFTTTRDVRSELSLTDLTATALNSHDVMVCQISRAFLIDTGTFPESSDACDACDAL